MDLPFIADKEFKSNDFHKNKLSLGEYECCTFKDCNFANANLSGINFRECSFSNSDFSNSIVTGASFTEATFKNCKLIGLRFDECNDFLFSPIFDGCNLSYASFFSKKYNKGQFNNCKLTETDFSQASLVGASFIDCDLGRALFHNTNIEKANFKTSRNFVIDPEQNRIAKASFSLETIPGLLVKYNINIE